MEQLLTDNIHLINFIFRILPWILLGGWFLYFILVVFNKDLRNSISNFYIVQSIPNVFVTLGLFGTFMGITYGLLFFSPEPEQIKESIEQLIEGISTAMFTSITGIFFSLITSKIIKVKVQNKTIKEPESPELKELKALNQNFQEFKNAISTSHYNALVESLKDVLQDFNNVFKDFLEDLVQRNFQELNETINQLNEWQKEHKEDVEELKNAYKSLVEKHKLFVEKTNEWVEKLDEVSGQSSKLQEVIDEFNDAFREDGNLSQMVKEIKESADHLKQVTENYSEITNKMNATVDSITVTGNKIDEWTESVQNVSEDSKQLVENLKSIQSINGNFDERLQKTFESFDALIKEYIEYLENKMNGRQ